LWFATQLSEQGYAHKTTVRYIVAAKRFLTKKRLTFGEAIQSPEFTLMSRHRLSVAQQDAYARLDGLAV
jgi:hypothetical protein